LPGSSAKASDAQPWRRVDSEGSITLAIRVQPGARRSEIAGVVGGELKIRLAARAAEGQANAALLALLADAFGVPRHALTLVRGATSRRKVVRVAAPRRRPDRAWAD